MKKTTMAMAALVLALTGGAAYAEGSDSGGGGGGGDSGDNSMSVLTGESYAAFEAARTGKPHVEVTIAGNAKKPEPVMTDELSERYARTNPFREDTA